jgi:hypothetical protein
MLGKWCHVISTGVESQTTDSLMGMWSAFLFEWILSNEFAYGSDIPSRRQFRLSRMVTSVPSAVYLFIYLCNKLVHYVALSIICNWLCGRIIIPTSALPALRAPPGTAGARPHCPGGCRLIWGFHFSTSHKHLRLHGQNTLLIYLRDSSFMEFQVFLYSSVIHLLWGDYTLWARWFPDM